MHYALIILKMIHKLLYLDALLKVGIFVTHDVPVSPMYNKYLIFM